MWMVCRRYGGLRAARSGFGPACHCRTKSQPGPFDIRPLVFRPLIRPATGDRSRGRGGRVLADPLVLPGVVVLLLVAAGPVHGDQLAGDLLAVGAGPARRLIGADVDLPLRSGPADP